MQLEEMYRVEEVAAKTKVVEPVAEIVKISLIDVGLETTGLHKGLQFLSAQWD